MKEHIPHNPVHLKKYFSLRHYLSVMRRAPKHMKHVYSFVFASAVTLLLVCIILYVDYGFWHDKYDSSQDLTAVGTNTRETKPESPGAMTGRFWAEIESKWASVNQEGANIGKSLFESKDTYKREE